MLEMQLAEGQDADAGADVDDFRAGDFKLEVVRQFERCEERTRARIVVQRRFVPVFMDEDLVVECEDIFLKQFFCMKMRLRLCLGQFRH